MFKLQFFCVVISLSFLLIQAARLPTYLTQCSQSSPNINECFKKNANLGIPQIVKGDIYYDIPCMKPLKYSEPLIRKESDFAITLTNVEIHGLELANVTDVELDLLKGTFRLDISIPSILAFGEYACGGNLYGFPLWRSGHFNRKLDGIKIQYSNSFVANRIDGDEFFNILTSKANFETDKENYDFRGLIDDEYNFFGYDIGHHLKGSLGLRIEQISTEMRSSINKKIADFITSIFNGILSRVPRADFFKP